MNKAIIPEFLVLTYLVVALLTFGYAANVNYSRQNKVYTDCRADGSTYCFRPNSMESGMNGLAAAVGWPLYWSWAAAEKLNS